MANRKSVKDYITFLMYLSIVFLLGISCSVEAMDNYTAFGDYLFQQQEYDRAVTEYYRDLFQSPSKNKLGFLDLRLGIAFAAGRDVDKARFFLTQVLEQHPQSKAAGWALLSLAKLYYQKHYYDLSMQTINTLLKAEPYDAVFEEARTIKTWNYLSVNAWDLAADWNESSGGNAALSQNIREGNRLKLKSPFLGGFASALFPGAGHFYAGMWKDGIVSFLLNSTFGYAAYQSFHHDNTTSGWILTFFELTWYSGNIYTGIGSVHKANKKTVDGFLNKLIKHDLPPPNLTFDLPD